MSTPESTSNAIMNILRGRGVRLIGVLVFVLIGQTVVICWIGNRFVDQVDRAQQHDTKTILSKDEEIKFLREYIFDEQKEAKLEKNRIIEKNSALQDSMYKLITTKHVEK